MLAEGSQNTRSLGSERADKYDVDKCKVTHMAKSTLTTHVPRRAPPARGRALRADVDSSLEMSARWSAAVKKAHRMLAMIKRGAEEKSEHIITVLRQSILDTAAPGSASRAGAAPRVGLACGSLRGIGGAPRSVSSLEKVGNGDFLVFLTKE